jgi:hypothetical protein
MLRPGPWAAAAALGAVLVAGESQAQVVDRPPRPAPAAAAPAQAEKPGFFGRLFGQTAKPAPAAPAPPPNPGSVAASQRQDEQEVYLRRLGVCDRIRAIAYDLGDQKLEAQADALEKQAERVYQQRTAHLPSSRVKSDATETALDEQLGTAAGGAEAADRLAPPQPAAPATASAQRRGVKP